MSDEMLIVVGLILAVLAVPKVRDARWIRGVIAQYPSIAIGIQRRYIDAVAWAGVGFAVVGLNTALALAFTDVRTILPMGVALVILLAIALGLEIPGRRMRADVRRLVQEEQAKAFHAGPVLPDDRV